MATQYPSNYQQDIEQPSGWTGWVAFAAIMMIIAGALQAFVGLVALFNDQWVVWGREAALLVDITSWGWFHILWGPFLVLVGILLMRGNMFGRVVGVIAASLSLILNFAFLPVYPFWSIMVIVIDVLVIYAIVVHGREMKALR